MQNAEADHNEEVFLRDCLILKAQLEQEAVWKRKEAERKLIKVVRKINHLGTITTTDEITFGKDDLPRAQPCRSFLRPGDATLMPQYPRDTTSISDEVRNNK